MFFNYTSWIEFKFNPNLILNLRYISSPYHWVLARGQWIIYNKESNFYLFMAFKVQPSNSIPLSPLYIYIYLIEKWFISFDGSLCLVERLLSSFFLTIIQFNHPLSKALNHLDSKTFFKLAYTLSHTHVKREREREREKRKEPSRTFKWELWTFLSCWQNILCS